MYRREWMVAFRDRATRGGERAAPRLAARAAAFGLVIALAVALLIAVSGSVPGSPAGKARAADETVQLNNMRTGWDPGETAMRPSAVPKFVRRFATAVAGPVWAQPLVIDSTHTVIVATENDQVYGLNATSGAVKWHTSLGTPYNLATSPFAALRSCKDLYPDVGVTGTPAYDPHTGRLYVFAQVVVNGNPKYNLFALDAATGRVMWTARIQGHPYNNRNISFKAGFELERPGALLLNGTVFAAFGSHCDHKPYAGYVTAINVGTHAVKLWTDESGVAYNEGGIWQSGGGLMADPSGQIFAATSNGISPPAGPGGATPGQLGESVVRLAVNRDGTVSAKDFFSQVGAPQQAATNLDFGAGGPVGLPFGTATYPNVMVQAGKDGHIFLLNRNNLGGREQGPGGTDDSLFTTSQAYGGQFGHPAVFFGTPATLTASTTDDFLFYLGNNDFLRAFRFGVSSSGAPTLSDVANGAMTNGFGSGSPVVTSDGTDPGSAVVWVVAHAGQGGGVTSVLQAYALGQLVSSGSTPSPCTSAAPCQLTPIWSANVGTAVKFCTPATSNGWVYVGTGDDHVLGFSLPAAKAAAVGKAATFSPTKISTSITKRVSVTAQATIRFTGVKVTTGAANTRVPTNEFRVGRVTRTRRGSRAPVPVRFPVTLRRGDKLTASVTFRPAAPGAADGTLAFTTSSRVSARIDVPLSADGTQEGLIPQASAVSMLLPLDTGPADVPVGITETQVLVITNFGTTTQTVTSVSGPSRPFSASGLPAVGTRIRPGKTISVQVSYTPTAPGKATGSLRIAGSSGRSATVSFTGTGAAAVSDLATTDPVVKFGNIPVGKRATRYVRISNNGNQVSTVAGTSALPRPFAAPLRPAFGLPLIPDNDMAIPVIFTPARRGPFTARYRLSWTDPTGSHALTVILTGTGT
jgi:outer membrane protein assembly factor BamB